MQTRQLVKAHWSENFTGNYITALKGSQQSFHGRNGEEKGLISKNGKNRVSNF